MNKNCIIRPHYAGLFSLINNVITCAELYEKFHVDWSGCIYSSNGENVWNALFEPTMLPDAPFDLIEGYPDQWLTYKNSGLLYQGGNKWRAQCHALWKKLRVRQWIVDNAEMRYDSMVSALIRSDVHAGEQLSGRSQPLDEYGIAIESEMDRLGADSVYIMCQDNETFAWFNSRFSVTSHPMTKRADSRGDAERHLSVPQTVVDAAVCLEEVLIASMAESFIHPVSNMATAALYINPELKSIHLP